MELEIIRSNKGGEKLCVDGYLYTKSKAGSEKVYWRRASCIKFNCAAMHFYNLVRRKCCILLYTFRSTVYNLEHFTTLHWLLRDSTTPLSLLCALNIHVFSQS